MIGVFLIDKPVGMTSTDAVRMVRRHAGLRRVGHAGTLDPAASGLLLVCVGEATKLVPYLVTETKEYLADGVLGTETLTDDAESEAITTASWDHVTEASLANVLQKYEGECLQKPPRVSAIKRGGERFYKRVRRGEDVDAELPDRPVIAHRLSLLDCELPKFSVEMVVGKGFYVRSLVRDVGRDVQSAAHVTRLRRTRVGQFTVDNACSPHELPTEPQVSICDALNHLETIHADQQTTDRLRWGQRPQFPGDESDATALMGQPIRVLDTNNALVAIATVTEEKLLKVLRGFEYTAKKDTPLSEISTQTGPVQPDGLLE